MTTKQILGVKFFSGSPEEAVDAGLRGGLVVVPSAPVLVGIEKDLTLRAAVLGADLAITDSGLMVLMWWLLKGEKLERVSGLEYLKLLLERLRAKSEGQSAEGGGQMSDVGCRSSVFWVMPTMAARDQNLAWLRSQGFATTVDDCYIAPHYGAGELHDEALLELVRRKNPAHIIIALGGGVQERLGFALREALRAKSEEQGAKSEAPGAKGQISDNKAEASGGEPFPLTAMPYATAPLPGIHCIGAAIGFLSGEQVRIPMWVDYLYLGWLWRSVSAPTKFVPRYWKAARLVPLMIRYGAEAPVADQPRAKC